MKLIVDASVAIKWFVRETQQEQALRLLTRRDDLEAPDIIIAEVANVTWKKCLRGEMAAEQAKAATIAIQQFPARLHPIAPFAERALEMALSLKHPIYDCLYLACAEANGATLVTADQRLCKALKGTEFEKLICHLDRVDTLEVATEQPEKLKISLQKLESLSDAAKKHHAADDNISKRFETSFVPVSVVSDSVNFHRKRKIVSDLSLSEKAEVLALGWYGTGYEEHSDWQKTLHKARRQIEYADKNNDPSFDNYISGYAIEIEKGLERLQQEYPSLFLDLKK